MPKDYIEPFTGPLSDFPRDPEVPEGVEVIQLQDRPVPPPVFHLNVVYDRKNDVDLHLQILTPFIPYGRNEKYPLIVFIPGSAWMKQAYFQSLPNMIRMSQKGYATAIVEYRHTGLAGFPAQAEDAKTAIRFMRLHAEEYHVDTERIAVWGDSSGGHTALMAGLTIGDYPDNGTYGDVSSAVSCIVDWYGPTDIIEMNSYPSAMDHIEPASPEGRLIGFKNVRENPELTRKASPLYYLFAEKEIPPLLIMHGNRDQLVCYQQSVFLYQKMKELGKDVQMYCLDGAYHGFGGFQSDEALEIVDRFIRSKM